MALPDSHLLDEYATAFVAALAAAAGSTVAISHRDYGVDGTLKEILTSPSGGYAETGFAVDFQLKGTTTAQLSATEVTYDLAVRNYNLIVERPVTASPYYLFLVCFPRPRALWMEHEADKLVFNASAFWWTSTGLPSKNKSQQRIKIPMINRLDPNGLKGLLLAAQTRFMP